MVGKIDCPNVEGIYCLDHFWNHKAMKEICKKILSKGLAHAYEVFCQGGSDNSILVREKTGVVSMCPGHHHGQLGDLRLVMIVDPRKTSRGLVSLFFPRYHNKEYSSALDDAQNVHDSFQEITFATKKDLERFKNDAPVHVRPLVVVGFYDVIFKESNEQELIVKTKIDDTKDARIDRMRKQQIESTYAKTIEDLYSWYLLLSANKIPADTCYKDYFKELFLDYSTMYDAGWEKHIKDILMNHKDKKFSDFVLPYLVMWELENSGPVYQSPQDNRGI